MLSTTTNTGLRQSFVALLMLLFVGSAAHAQTGGETSFQIVHNSPDPLVSEVDIIITAEASSGEVVSEFFYDRVSYLDATPLDTAFFDTPTFPSSDSITLYVNYYVADVPDPTALTPFSTYTGANGSPDVIDTIVAFDGEDYIAIAEGIVDAANLPGLPDFRTTVVNSSLGTAADSTLIAFHHGSPDAPNIDLNRIENLTPTTLAANVPFSATSGFANYETDADPPLFFELRVNSSGDRVSTYTPVQNASDSDDRHLILATGFLDTTQGPGNLEEFRFVGINLDGGQETVLPGTFAQIGHFSPDDAAQNVDLIVEVFPGVLDTVASDVSFGDATAITFVPAVGNLEIVPTGQPISNSAFTVDLTGIATDTYNYYIAHGIFPSSTGYNVNMGTEFNVLEVPEFRTASTDPTKAEIVLLHASPDAPNVDASARDGGTVVSDLGYGEYEIIELDTEGFLLDLTTVAGPVGEALYTYRLRPTILNQLVGNRVISIAGGFVDSVANNNGPDFISNTVLGLPAVLPLEEVTTASVQVVHNSGDPAADEVDVYYNADATPTIDDFAYQQTSGKVDLLANTDVRLSVNANSSTGTNDQELLALNDARLLAGEEYFIVVDGFANPADFEANPDGNSTALDFYIKMAETRDPAADSAYLHVFHGATDAPGVDLVETDLNATLVDGATYGNFSDEIPLADATYELELQADSDNSTLVDYASLPISGLLGANHLLVATGFLTPGDANGDPAGDFFVGVAPNGGGALDPLSIVTGRADLNIANVGAYPNPATETFNIGIALSENADMDVTITDLQGRTVMTQQVADANIGEHVIRLDVSTLPAGLYVYNVDANGQTVSGKLSIMR